MRDRRGRKRRMVVHTSIELIRNCGVIQIPSLQIILKVMLFFHGGCFIRITRSGWWRRFRIEFI
jgi:hypothetical protein